MDSLHFKSIWTIIGYGLIILLVVLSLYPKPILLKPFSWADKVYHSLAYGGVMLWFTQLYPKSCYGRLACFFIALGILMELMQSLGNTRTGEVWDVAANSLGTVLSWGLALKGMNTLLHQFENWYLKPRKEQ